MQVLVATDNVATLDVGATDIFISQQPYGSWGIEIPPLYYGEPPSNPGAYT